MTGLAGQRGTDDDSTQALGGDGRGNAAGDGGGGGYGAALDGERGLEYCWPYDSSVAGGGGGAVGRIRINTIETYVPNCVISPTPSTAAFSMGDVLVEPAP